MKSIKVSICDYVSLRDNSVAVIVFNSMCVISVDELYKVTFLSEGSNYMANVGIIVEIVRLACVAGFDSEGNGMYVAKCVKV